MNNHPELTRALLTFAVGCFAGALAGAVYCIACLNRWLYCPDCGRYWRRNGRARTRRPLGFAPTGRNYLLCDDCLPRHYEH